MELDIDIDKDLDQNKSGNVKKVYEIGQDYESKHTFSVTNSGTRTIIRTLKKKQVNRTSKTGLKGCLLEKSIKTDTKDWEERLKETYDRMLNKLEDSQDNKYIEKLEIVESEYQGRKVKLNDSIQITNWKW